MSLGECKLSREPALIFDIQNNQERSFIEQQLAFYGRTGCFGKSQEVLTRDVEIVEYMNDLIDLFE